MNDERFEEHKATIAYGIGHLVRDHEDTPGAVAKYVQPMLEELAEAYEEEHYQRLTMDTASAINAERGNDFEATIEKLHKSLRHILITAKNAGDFKTDALNWIEGEAARILIDAGLETEVTLP